MEGSFSSDLVGSFSQIKLKVYEESTMLSEFSNFLQKYIEIFCSFLTKMKNLLGPLRKIINTRNFDDSISLFMKSFIQSIDNGLEESEEYAKLSLNPIFTKFQDFTENYQNNFKSINKEIDNAFHHYNELEGKVIQLKCELDEFKLSMNDISTLQHSMSTIQRCETNNANEEKAKITKTTIKAKLKQYQYLNEAKSFNEFVKKTGIRFLELLGSIELNEKNRIIFIKDSMTNFLQETLNFQNRYMNHIINNVNNLDNIKVKNDMQGFIERNMCKDNPFQPIEFSSPTNYKGEEPTFELFHTFLNQSPKHNIKNKIIFLDIKDEIDILITDYLQLVFSETVIDPKESELLEQEMRNKVMQDKFVSFFSQIRCKKIENIDSIKNLGKLVNCFLDNLNLEPQLNMKLENISPIVTISQKISCKVNHKELFLLDLIKSHKIWENEDLWISLNRSVIEEVFIKWEDAFMKKNEKYSIALQTKLRLSDLLLSGFSETLNLLTDVEDSLLTPGENQLHKNFQTEKRKIIFYELCGLIQTMFNFNIRQSIIHHNIILLSKEYNIPSENVQTLLCDLCRYHQIIITNPSLESEREYSLSKRQKERTKFDNNKINMILAYCISFTNSPSSLIRFLRLNKEISKKFKSKIAKILYYTRKNTIQTKNLPEFWSTALKVKYLKIDYLKLRNDMIKNKEKLEVISNTINTDIERFQRDINGFDIREQLTNILMCYAYYDNQVQYCQGMNFLVGLILAIMKTEEMTFKVLTQLIKQNEMSLLFSDCTPLLRQFFYQLDKLIYIYLPDLSLHFKKEGIISNYFASSWFITLFTYIAQCHKSKEISPFIIEIWNQFILVLLNSLDGNLFLRQVCLSS